jgi:hypothetical protein
VEDWILGAAVDCMAATNISGSDNGPRMEKMLWLIIFFGKKLISPGRHMPPSSEILKTTWGLFSETFIWLINMFCFIIENWF